MKLATIRDVALAIGGAAFAVFVVEEVVGLPRRKPTAGRAVGNPPYGHLWRLSTWAGQPPEWRYVRPATESERDASAAAARLDGGAGVFGCLRDGAPIVPGTGEWDTARGDEHVPYFRVGA